MQPGPTAAARTRAAPARAGWREWLPAPLAVDGGPVPVLDAEQRLAGIITQSDVVRALARLE